MKDKIFGILKHSALYSFGTIAQKGMGIITLPINAYYLSKAEFGNLEILEILIVILSEVITLGQANSVIYFNTIKDFSGKAKSIFFTIVVLIFSSGFFFAIAAFIANIVSPQLFDQESYFCGNLTLVVTVSILRAINSVFFNKLRGDEKSFQYAVITLIKIFFTIVLILIFVVLLNLTIVGILYAYTISEIICLIIFVPAMIKQMEYKFSTSVASKTLNYGMPLIFSALGAYILNLSDRFLIKSFFDSAAVGVYGFAYKIAGILQTVLIIPFSSALLPSTYKQYNTPGDKRYYGKLMTYMCFVLIWGSLVLSLFGSVAVNLFGGSKYSGAEIFVPVLLLSYIFSSMKNVANTGLLVSEKTIYIGILTVVSGAFNVVLNIWLLPIYGVIVAAYTTLAAYLFLYFSTKFVADKHYTIPVETNKIIKLFFVGVGSYLLCVYLPISNMFLGVLLKFFVAIIFPFVMYAVNFYEEIELITIKNSIKKLRRPSDIKNIIQNLLSR